MNTQVSTLFKYFSYKSINILENKISFLDQNLGYLRNQDHFVQKNVSTVLCYSNYVGVCSFYPEQESIDLLVPVLPHQAQPINNPTNHVMGRQRTALSGAKTRGRDLGPIQFGVSCISHPTKVNPGKRTIPVQQQKIAHPSCGWHGSPLPLTSSHYPSTTGKGHPVGALIKS